MISEKEKCDIATDLLPLYMEQLTQKETNQWLKEHLFECEQCREMYQWMEQSLIEPSKEDKSKKKKKGKVKSLKKIKIRLFLWVYVLILIAVWFYCMIDAIFFL